MTAEAIGKEIAELKGQVFLNCIMDNRSKRYFDKFADELEKKLLASQTAMKKDRKSVV